MDSFPSRPSDKPSSPLLTAARLFSKTSSRGADYLTGRMGNLRVLVMVNKHYVEGDPENGNSHVLLFGEAPPYQPKQAEAAPQPALPLQPPARPYGRDYGARQPADKLKKRVDGTKTVLIDDVVPF